MFKGTTLALWGVIFSLVLGVGMLQAGEKVTGSDADEVRSAIESYVKQDTNLKGGFFIYDENENKLLNLTYDHVHKGVEKTEGGEYYACVDFVDSDKNTYDIDIYVDKEGESLNISKMIIHKVNGEDRLKN